MATLSLKKKVPVSSDNVAPQASVTRTAVAQTRPVKKTISTSTIHLETMKISVVLPAESISAEICPAIGVENSSKIKVILTLAVPQEAEQTLYLTVPFSPTNYRRTLHKIDALKAEGKSCIVLLQGKLQGDGIVKEAGLTVHESP
ncbi:hypothetical protein [Beggiatoa leptomitoformis]|uniref:Uncharacterized protein n=1 Tax=Beggiatoa leptomitoformis TaxID=288004 RepID=A0A2N9YGB5_9GAMM|nr:hypothetical protein [Beggiatoa leptomitoformis]ALG68141.1 hypothetical protein AL038_11005 [Beggiatoa leptomitoformis]AUI69562.1 hypothetical protein BLE401_13255 [Beggiatoa leptomitoformis]